MHEAIAIEEPEDLFGTLAERAQTGVVIIQHGRFNFVNAHLEKILGFRKGALLGRDWLSIVLSEDRAAVRQSVAQALRADSSLPFEFRVVAHDDTIRWLSGTVTITQFRAGPAIMASFADITDHKRAELQFEKRLRSLSAPGDATAVGPPDRRATADTILDYTMAQLGIDSAALLKFDRQTQTLHYVAVRRRSGQPALPAHIPLGEGCAGQAAAQRRVVCPSNLNAGNGSTLPTGQGAPETHCAVPLIYDGQLRGVLEVFARRPLATHVPWMALSQRIAAQIAVCFEQVVPLERPAGSIAVAKSDYDRVIDAWARTLDSREHESEGHATRVTELTLRLAGRLGCGDSELPHVRRGALLHDVGNVAIPDSVLLKTHPLTDEERALIRKHPVYAHELLATIPPLSPALDIPYCHHERWDGQGYPRGLKGEDIPVAARIFALADAWDALRSDRPYRPAWPSGQARDHIVAEQGRQFDPRVVEAFLTLEG